MAANKVFETLFKIAARYTGKPAFVAVNRDINRTEKNAANASRNIRGMFTAVKVGLGGFAAYAGYKAFRGIFDIGGKALDAAKDVQKANDLVRQANERLVKQGRLRRQDLEKQTQGTIAFSEAMEKAGGIDAETLQGGLAKLSEVFSSIEITQMSKGWQDWMVKIHQGAPTLEQSIEASQKLIDFVEKGKAKSLEGLGITKEQIEIINKLNTPLARQAAILKIVGKETGATSAWKKTAAGIEYDLGQAQEANLETLGGPLADAQLKMNVALTDLFKALLPVSKIIAEEMSPRLQDLAKWITENKDRIIEWTTTAASGVIKIWDAFAWLQSKSQEFFKPIWENTLKELDWLKTNVLDPITAHFETAWNNIQQGASKAFEGIKAIWSGLSGYFGSLVGSVATALAPMYEAIIGPFRKAFDWIIKNDPAKGYIPPTTGEGVGGGGMATEMQKFETSQRGGAIPTTKYSKGGRFGPDEMTDRWTERGYTSTGPNLMPGVVAVNTKRYPLGTVFKDKDSGKVYVAADRHGNVNPNVVDVFRSAASYRNPGKENLSVIGKMGKVPGNREALRSELSKFGTPPSASLRNSIRGMSKTGGTGGQGPTNVTVSPSIVVNGVAPGREQLAANQVAKAIRDPIREGIAQLKAMRAHESRLGYV